jgi:hypothetical protein
VHHAHDQSLAGWQAACNVEKQKHKPAASPQLRERQRVETKAGHFAVRSYHYPGADSVQAIGTSTDAVLLGIGGRYSQAFCEDKPVHIWATRERRLVTLTPPVRDYLLKHRSLHPFFQGLRHASITMELAHLNLEKGIGGLLLRLPQSDKTTSRQRYLYLHWDLRQNALLGHLPLSTTACNGQFRVLGFQATSQRLFVMREEGYDQACKVIPGQMRKAILAISWPSAEKRILARFDHAYRLEKAVASDGLAKIAIAEYTELPREQGRVFILDTHSGKIQQKAIPKTPYGLIFTPDQQALLVYSAKQAILTRIPLSLASSSQSERTQSLGHAMGLSHDRKHVYLLFHGGIEIRDTESLKKIDYLPLRKILGNAKFVHVDGSAILHGHLFVKNGDALHVHLPIAPQATASVKAP